MTVQHTPGPWSAEIPSASNGYVWIDPVDGCCGEIATVWNTHDNSEANARLIAAAPDLLEALKAVVNDWVAPDDLPFEDGEMPALDAARAAIAKATGEAA